ncbi:MAG: hypothetical protein JW755_07035 [Candidatus Aminicenantes bacterium]|nr:hypothetical protein [Candidatus Aminicenantes bacterium]
MKKYGVILITIMLLSGSLWSSDYAFYFDLSGNYLASPDEKFRSFYSEDSFFPELTAGVRVLGDLCLWAGYGFFNSEGTTDYLYEEMKAKQSYLAGGLSYRRMLTDDFGFKIALGALQAAYREEGMDMEISGSALGFRADGGILIYIGKVYLELSNGYLYARDDVNGQKIKLGGYRIGLAFGVQF